MNDAERNEALAMLPASLREKILAEDAAKRLARPQIDATSKRAAFSAAAAASMHAQTSAIRKEQR